MYMYVWKRKKEREKRERERKNEWMKERKRNKRKEKKRKERAIRPHFLNYTEGETKFYKVAVSQNKYSAMIRNVNLGY